MYYPMVYVIPVCIQKQTSEVSIQTDSTSSGQQNAYTKSKKLKRQKAFAYRNAISNIINKILSFILAPQSKQTIQKLLNENQNIQEFLELVSNIKKSKHNYFNFRSINILFYEDCALNEINKKYIGAIRKMFYYFIQQIGVQYILTSKRMQLKQIHLYVLKRIKKKMMQKDLLLFDSQ